MLASKQRSEAPPFSSFEPPARWEGEEVGIAPAVEPPRPLATIANAGWLDGIPGVAENVESDWSRSTRPLIAWLPLAEATDPGGLGSLQPQHVIDPRSTGVRTASRTRIFVTLVAVALHLGLILLLRVHRLPPPAGGGDEIPIEVVLETRARPVAVTVAPVVSAEVPPATVARSPLVEAVSPPAAAATVSPPEEVAPSVAAPQDVPPSVPATAALSPEPPASVAAMEPLPAPTPEAPSPASVPLATPPETPASAAAIEPLPAPVAVIPPALVPLTAAPFAEPAPRPSLSPVASLPAPPPFAVLPPQSASPVPSPRIADLRQEDAKKTSAPQPKLQVALEHEAEAREAARQKKEAAALVHARAEAKAAAEAKAKALAEAKAKAKALAEAKAKAAAEARRARVEQAVRSVSHDAPALARGDPSTAEDAAAYGLSVIGRINAAKRYPEAARDRGAQGTAIVSFSIGSSGEPRGISLARSSGDATLDAEALATVLRAGPFPPPPAGASRRFSAPIAFRLR